MLKDGRAEAAESQRTKRRALERLQEIVISQYPRTKEAHLCVMHGDAEKEAQNLAASLCEKINISNIPIYKMPPAILVHAGPGVLAASLFVE